MIRDTFSSGVEPGGLHSHHEIKLLICYILTGVKEPLSRESILEVLCQDGMANYFDTSAAIDELIALNNLKEAPDKRLVLTQTGRTAAATLADTLPYTLRERSVKAALHLLVRQQNEKENHVDIHTDDHGTTVTCIIGAAEAPLLTITLPVTDTWQAELIRHHFLENPLMLYQATIGLLTGKATGDNQRITIDLN